MAHLVRPASSANRGELAAVIALCLLLGAAVGGASMWLAIGGSAAQLAENGSETEAPAPPPGVNPPAPATPPAPKKPARGDKPTKADKELVEHWLKENVADPNPEILRIKAARQYNASEDYVQDAKGSRVIDAATRRRLTKTYIKGKVLWAKYRHKSLLGGPLLETLRLFIVPGEKSRGRTGEDLFEMTEEDFESLLDWNAPEPKPPYREGI